MPVARTPGILHNSLRIALFCLLLRLMQALLELAKFILCNLFFFIQNLSENVSSVTAYHLGIQRKT